MKKVTIWIVLGFVALGVWVWMRSGPDIRPLKNGYGISIEPMGFERAGNARYWFTTPSGQHLLIWPWVGFGDKGIEISGDLAVFQGLLRHDDGLSGRAAVFAVRAPGPAVRINKRVLKRYATKTGQAIASIDQSLDAGFKISGESVEFGFIRVPEFKGFDVRMSWNEIGELVDECKKTGVLKHFDGVTYYE